MKELPKTYNPQEVEDAIYQKWEREGWFAPEKYKRLKNAAHFSIVMPPPNVTGTLHVGHAVMLAIEDIMTRYHRMRGDDTVWIPGTDHAAIATQTKVEKLLMDEQKMTRHDLGREKFLAEVAKFVQISKDTIHRQVRKMGSSCDWSREAYTMDAERSLAVRTVFKKMYDNGLIYRGIRLVNWCVRCASTLADDEVEHEERHGKLYFITYKLDSKLSVSVTTTRPETKLGDTGLAVHPDDIRYKKLIGKTFMVDLAGHKITVKVFVDKSIDMKFGSGVVGVTPAHSVIDAEFARKNNLPSIQIIDEAGNMTRQAGKYAGMSVGQARDLFVHDLDNAGLLEKTEDIKHSLSLCYRCGTTVEPLPSKQWFVGVTKKFKHIKTGKMTTLKDEMIKAVKSEEIKIIPERFDKTYFHWIDNLRDWCISRQIWFGHQIPVWYCQDFKSKECKDNDGVIVSSVAPSKCPFCGSTNLKQDSDTLDTWFSSGLWTFSTLGWPNKSADLKRFHPNSVLETGYDILFFWVARMILMSTYILGEVPFKNVYLHGLVRDKQGRKMSKSLGNVIDPLEVIAKYGTDAVRLALVVGTTPGNDVKMSEEKIADYRNFTNKLWNISRYVLMNVKKVTVSIKQPKTKTLTDRVILELFRQTLDAVTHDLETFQFSAAAEKLRQFTWDTFADWYLEIAKIEKNKDEILIYILSNLLKAWHPFMPFVTEELWKNFSKPNQLLIGESCPVMTKTAVKAGDISHFEDLQSLVQVIRSTRQSFRVSPGKFVEVTLRISKTDAWLKKEIEILKGLARIDQLHFTAKKVTLKKVGFGVSAFGIEAYVHLDASINTEQEVARLKKELTTVLTDLNRGTTQLANKDFLKHAKKEVIMEIKTRVKYNKERIKGLKQQIKLFE